MDQSNPQKRSLKISEKDLVTIEQRKPAYPISGELFAYLRDNGRSTDEKLHYDDLRDFSEQIPLYDHSGLDTYWQTVLYPPSQRAELEERLCLMYAWLKMEGNTSYLEHLYIDRIDYCEFGNSQPFRIRVVNRHNDNHDYYYVKKADSSRIYGLELEHILAPNRINFLVYEQTLIEEHISGVPGDVFVKRFIGSEESGIVVNRTRISKEFVKFSERCFVKLLGDMRSYNFVMVLTQDFDSFQYRVRAIDFDRQCHEGDIRVYMPQFYKENQPIVEMVWEQLSPATIRQYQSEERSLMKRRAISATRRLNGLFTAMGGDYIAPEENFVSLATMLADYHKDQRFTDCLSMGELTRRHLYTTLELKI